MNPRRTSNGSRSADVRKRQVAFYRERIRRQIVEPLPERKRAKGSVGRYADRLLLILLVVGLTCFLVEVVLGRFGGVR